LTIQQLEFLKENKMDHVAIMKKSWRLIPKILSGEKTVESRWYKAKVAPWDRISAKDTVYFKNSGEDVSVKVRVSRVLQFGDLDKGKIKKILKKYGQRDLGIEPPYPQEVRDYIFGKNYCLLIFFNQVRKIKPFKINKTGFGAMAAWLCVDDIGSIKT